MLHGEALAGVNWDLLTLPFIRWEFGQYSQLRDGFTVFLGWMGKV